MEDKIKNSLDRLNEAQTSDLLDKDISLDIDKDTVLRIKASVYKKLRADKRPSNISRKLIACAAAVLLVFCTIFAVGFDNVVASVRQVIQYIPGFGKAPEKSSNVSVKDNMEVKVMKEPVIFEVNGEKIEIYSSWLTGNNDETTVTAIIHYPKDIKLDENIAVEYNGQKINRDSEITDYSEDNKAYKEIVYGFTIKSPQTDINTLIFMMGDSKASIAYKNPEDLKDKVIAQNFNGIIVSAIPLDQNRSKFILNSSYEKQMSGVMFQDLFISGDSEIRAVDEFGKEYEVKKSTYQGSEYYVDGNIKGKIVSLKFSKLNQGFTYENSKSLKGIKFNIPKVGEKIEINKDLDNSICSINLETVERVERNSNSPVNLIFTYKMKSKIPDLNISNMALYVEKTGGATAGNKLEEYKEGDSYIVKYGVLADENSTENIVTIVPYGSFYSDILTLDKECVIRF